MIRPAIPFILLTALVALTALASAASAGEAPGFAVPRLAGIDLDGDAADWADSGLRIAILGQEAPRDEADFDPRLRLGWDDAGLLVLVEATDDLRLEGADDQLYRGDSLELFMASAPGSADLWQAILAPGGAPGHDGHRQHLIDLRKGPAATAGGLAIEVARGLRPDGWRLEARLPWRCLGLRPALGLEVGFQACVNDGDPDQGRVQALWFPKSGAHQDSTRLHRLTLAEAPSAPVLALLDIQHERFRRTRVTVTAASAPGPLEVTAEGPVPASRTATLAGAGRLAVAEVVLPMPARGQDYTGLVARLPGGAIARAPALDAEGLRADALARAELLVQPTVFTGTRLPVAEFEQPSLIEDATGGYRLRTTYYDADHAVVTSAARPGRYGAVVEISSPGFPTRTVFRTLYRHEEGVDWWRLALAADFALPAAYGIDPAIAAAQPTVLGDWVAGQLRRDASRGSDLAVLLAGLRGVAPGSGRLTRRESPAAIDRRWWHTLAKRTDRLVPLRYLLHVPPAAAQEPARRWPLLLFLHGSGERGSDLERVAVHGPPKLVRGRPDFPFIVASPQCPSGGWWSPEALIDLIDEVCARQPVDAERIYLTGLSMGGYGTWDLAMAYPERFAALVPICGGGDPSDAARIAGLPTWVFHGARDAAVPLARSDELVSALRALGGRVRYTVYPDADHDSWTRTYADERLYAWLLEQRRGQPRQPPATLAGSAPGD